MSFSVDGFFKQDGLRDKSNIIKKMTITSLLFLFLFLPVSLAVYYIANERSKEYVLLALSLLFYSLGSLQYFLLFLFAIIITVILGRSIAIIKIHAVKKLLLIIGILINVGLLGYYKYSNTILKVVNDLIRGGVESEFQSLLLPLGISFFTFKAISYLTDVYNGKVVLDQNPIHDMLYLSFFAQIQSGPISRYQEMNVRHKGLFFDGVYRFLIGFNKKILIANVLANITNEVFSNSFDNYSTAYAWLGSICYSLQLFFDFAGYSDMAIGISEMFGYNCLENFNYPYMTSSVSKFWRRWHISLSQWFRDYIYIPLGGSKSKNRFRVYINLFVVWLLTGIWHGTTLNFILWGMGYFLLIAFERLTGLPERIKFIPFRILYRILTLMFINFQWVLFRADTIRRGLGMIRRMFICDSNTLADSRTLFLLKDYVFFLTLAIILCFPVVPWINKKLENKRVLHTLFELIIGIIIIAGFVWAVSFVVSGQNNPFAYANF